MKCVCDSKFEVLKKCSKIFLYFIKIRNLASFGKEKETIKITLAKTGQNKICQDKN